MQITPTNHQFEAIQQACAWFKTASQEYVSLGSLRHMQDEIYYGSMRPGIKPGQLFRFAGYAGSGKSTCVAAMIEKMGLGTTEVMYLAPTGKAAKVLTEKLRNDGWSAGATTIHKAIYMPQAQKSAEIKADLDRLDLEVEERAKNPGSRFMFEELDDHQLQVRRLKRENELDDAMNSEGLSFTLKGLQNFSETVRLIVVDEASMVDDDIAEDLAAFNLPILAIGDPGQLPPINGQGGFEMEDAEVFLTEIHRQAAENPIIHLATLAREGEYIKPGTYGDNARVVRRRDDQYTLDMDNDAMVLIGTHNKRYAITTKIRDALGITSTGPVAGEPMLMQRNSRQHPTLVNGSILTCMEDVGELKNGNVAFDIKLQDENHEDLQFELKCPQCLFEEHHFKRKGAYTGQTKAVYAAKDSLEHVDWGHAITVHKAQGSEWDSVILHDESGVFRSNKDAWLYTGITRAKEDLTIIV